MKLILTIFFLFFSGFLIKGKYMTSERNIIYLGSNGNWIDLHPGLQHTAYADLLLSNQFDALVGSNEKGEIIPLGAKSWEISNDFKTFIFNINTDLKFSDGSQLSGFDYKKSWEQSLLLSPKSTNSSLLDVLYLLENFKNFESTKSLEGVIATENKLILNFAEPFRMALEHLQGNRFSAYKLDKKFQPIGTGKYVISKIDENEVNLTPNDFNSNAKDLNPINLKVYEPEIALKLMKEKKIDGFVFANSSSFKEPPEEVGLEYFSGFENAHKIIMVNGLKNSIFKSKELRLGLQFLMHKYYSELPIKPYKKVFFKEDCQVFLPFQQGRLDSKLAENIINKGRNFSEQVKIESRKKPFKLTYIYGSEWILELFKQADIEVKPNPVTFNELIQIIYKTNDTDLLLGGFSLAGSDPDNIYHSLGPSGAIMSKMMFREDVGLLLEAGRKLLNQNFINEHYSKVSETVLEEVPFYHIGFTKDFSIYRSDRLTIKSSFIRRNFGHLDFYELKK